MIISGVTITPGTGKNLQGRSTTSGTTTSIANGDTANLDLSGYKGYALMKIQTDNAAWVRVYDSDASRTSDSARSQGNDPTPGTGVLAEAIATGAETVIFSPAVVCYNNEVTPTTVIPISVTNNSGSAQTITITLTILQLED